MFSTKLTRAAPLATATVTSAASTTCRCLATRSSPHQRRHSSSKTSCPPDSRSKPAPAAKASAEEQESRSPASARLLQKSSKGRSRGGYKKVNTIDSKKDATPSGPIDQFAGLPSVPSIQNLEYKDFSTSAFFALHRPMSISLPIPPPTTDEKFNNIFETRQQHDPWQNGNSAERRPEDVIYTLHNTIETLENSSNAAQDEGVRWEVIHESPSNSDSVKHLDGAPRMKSLDELVAHFKPFRAPPPPQPFPEEHKPSIAERKAGQKSARGKQAKQKTFTTTITVREFTDLNGQKTYSASSSPIVRLPDSESQNLEQAAMREPDRKQRQPFLTRMRARQQVNTLGQQFVQASTPKSLPVRREPSDARQGRMRKFYLISVKRQRKLKMKKHKYKKLMKRTRTLRRKLDRN